MEEVKRNKKQRKQLQDLTFSDSFMFCAVMNIEANCIAFLEMVTGILIARVEVSYEKNIVYHPEYRGVRLDVYAKDENSTHYNVEMQVKKERDLGKRSRYYHSQMDMELLAAGADYEELPNTFVIFICDFDPFRKELYCYTFLNRCMEEGELILQDGCQTIFLSTKGKNAEDVPKSLVKFLRFVATDLEHSEEDFEDELVGQIQESIRHVKGSREMGERYMIFEEMMKTERREGCEEGRIEGLLEAVIDLLDDLGDISDELKASIEEVEDIKQLKKLHKLAAKAESLKEFEANAKTILILSEKNKKFGSF